MRIYPYKGYEVRILRDIYPNERIRLTLQYYNLETNSYVSSNICTLNVLDDATEDGNVVINDFFDNQGMLDFLLANSIISYPLRYIETEYTKIPVCKFLVNP